MTTTVEPEYDHASGLLQDMIRRNRNGEKFGVYAVCSAHPSVVDAACGSPWRTAQSCLSSRHRARSISSAVTRDRRPINSLSLFTPQLNKRDCEGNACCWAETISGRIRGGSSGLIGVGRVSNYQIVVSSIMGDTGKMNGSFHMQQRSAGFYSGKGNRQPQKKANNSSRTLLQAGAESASLVLRIRKTAWTDFSSGATRRQVRADLTLGRPASHNFKR